MHVPTVELQGDIDLKIGDKHALKSTAERFFSRVTTIPASYQALAAPLTYGFMAFPAVTPMKLWEVLELAVYPADPFTALAGAPLALAYISQQVPQDSNNEPPGFSQMIGVPVTIPNVLEKGRRSTLLRMNDRIIICMKGLPASANIIGSLSIIEHDMAKFFEKLED